MKQRHNVLSGAIKGLRKEGYTRDFTILGGCIACHAKNTLLSPDDFEIDIIYQFEGISDPDDQYTLYGISSSEYDLKGLLLMDGDGISAEEDTKGVVSRLHMHTV